MFGHHTLKEDGSQPACDESEVLLSVEATSNLAGEVDKLTADISTAITVDSYQRVLELQNGILSQSACESYRINIVNGQFMKQHEMFDTNSMQAFILTEEGKLFVFNKDETVTHASVGSAYYYIIGAGELMICHGKLTEVNTRGGAYQTNLFDVYQTLSYFQSQGVDISDVKVHLQERASYMLGKDIMRIAQKECSDIKVYLALSLSQFENGLMQYKYPTKLTNRFIEKKNKIFGNAELKKERGDLINYFNIMETLNGLEMSIQDATTYAALKLVHDALKRMMEDLQRRNILLSRQFHKKENSGHLFKTVNKNLEKLPSVDSKLRHSK